MAGLKRVIPDGMTLDEFINKRASEVPSYDPDLHKKLIGDAGSTPMWLSAREILSTHELMEGEGIRSATIARKTREAMRTDPYVKNYGTGTGKNLADSITKNGYDWSKAIPLSVKGVDWSDTYTPDRHTKSAPWVTQGHHRLAYMWTFHPDEPIPVDISNYQKIWAPEEQRAILDVSGGMSESEAFDNWKVRQKAALQKFVATDPAQAKSVLDDRE